MNEYNNKAKQNQQTQTSKNELTKKNKHKNKHANKQQTKHKHTNTQYGKRKQTNYQTIQTSTHNLYAQERKPKHANKQNACVFFPTKRHTKPYIYIDIKPNEANKQQKNKHSHKQANKQLTTTNNIKTNTHKKTSIKQAHTPPKKQLTQNATIQRKQTKETYEQPNNKQKQTTNHCNNKQTHP